MFQEVPVLLLVFPEETGRNWSGLDVTAHHWMVLEVSGCLWVYLSSSRMFGHRLVLAGQCCRCRVSVAHSRSRIEVVEVREQLGGQEVLAMRLVAFYGMWVPPQSHTCGGGG